MKVYWIRERDTTGRWVRRPWIIWCTATETF